MRGVLNDGRVVAQPYLVPGGLPQVLRFYQGFVSVGY